MATKKSAWTEADYEAAGKVKVGLRLDKTAAQILTDAADARGISRQALIEELLHDYQAKAEQPALTAEDLGAKPAKRKARK